ncbi:MAG: VOC family protein [Gammaproteobacteria bacterium]
MDKLHHVAIQVNDLKATVNWYQQHFACEVAYQDDTWALLNFDNLQLAFVIPGQHPPHIAFERPDAAGFGELKTHRDGTASVYIKDPSGNNIEVMQKPVSGN